VRGGDQSLPFLSKKFLNRELLYIQSDASEEYMNRMEDITHLAFLTQ
jgi:hypothetical protein